MRPPCLAAGGGLPTLPELPENTLDGDPDGPPPDDAEGDRLRGLLPPDDALRLRERRVLARAGERERRRYADPSREPAGDSYLALERGRCGDRLRDARRRRLRLYEPELSEELERDLRGERDGKRRRRFDAPRELEPDQGDLDRRRQRGDADRERGGRRR